MTINTNMYAQALFEAGLANDPLAYLENMDDFVSLVNSDNQIKDFFFKTYDEFDAVKSTLQDAFSKSFINFIEILYNDRALRSIENIKANYETLMMEDEKISVINIYSKNELSEEVTEQILSMLDGKYPKPFRISKHLDESLLGGYIVRVNGDVYDTSLKTKLLQIRKLGGKAYE